MKYLVVMSALHKAFKVEASSDCNSISNYYGLKDSIINPENITHAMKFKVKGVKNGVVLVVLK